MSVVAPDLSELFEEAYERAGLEMRSGYDLKTARRSLNLLTSAIRSVLSSLVAGRLSASLVAGGKSSISTAS